MRSIVRFPCGRWTKWAVLAAWLVVFVVAAATDWLDGYFARKMGLAGPFGRNFDPSVMETAESRRALLDSLIRQRLVASVATKANLTVTDHVLAEIIQ